MESFGACKRVDPLSASDASYPITLENTAYNDGCRYQLGMLWAGKRSSFAKNYSSRTSKKPSYAPTITSVLDKSYNLKIENK